MKSLEGILTQYDRRKFGNSNPRRTPREDKGRYQGCVSTGQGTWKIASKAQKLEERYVTDPLLEPSEEINVADTLISDFQPPELCDNKFLLFKDTQFVLLYYRSFSKLMYWVIHHFPIVCVCKTVYLTKKCHRNTKSSMTGAWLNAPWHIHTTEHGAFYGDGGRRDCSSELNCMTLGPKSLWTSLELRKSQLEN